MPTLLLNRSAVARNIQALLLLDDLREAFRTDVLARTVARSACARRCTRRAPRWCSSPAACPASPRTP
ncbi:hypothetical protein [Corallococcus sp. 4LFB]|uniref:hypothetical protein n=1 Tax=Corallococcus sp. 4LFB TaxID=3383249 RepID=UPI003975E9AF